LKKYTLVTPNILPEQEGITFQLNMINETLRFVSTTMECQKQEMWIKKVKLMVKTMSSFKGYN